MAIFGNIVLIAMGVPNVQQKIHNYFEKANNIFFLHMVVDFLKLIWFAYGNQNNFAKNHQFCCDMSYALKPVLYISAEQQESIAVLRKMKTRKGTLQF